MANLKEKYEQTVVPELEKAFGLKNPMQVPRLQKIVVNMAFGIVDKDTQKSVVDDLAKIIPYGCKFYLVGTLDPAYLPVVHVEDYTEREYTNASGDTVVLSVAEGQSSSFIFYESEDYLVTVRSTSVNTEALADCFDFAAMVRLSPNLSAVQNTSPSVAEVRDGLLTLADFAQTDEYLASSAFQTLFNEYYLPIANERLAQIGGHHPEGYSQLYYYGSFPTGIPELDEGLADILSEHPLET